MHEVMASLVEMRESRAVEEVVGIYRIVQYDSAELVHSPNGPWLQRICHRQQSGHTDRCRRSVHDHMIRNRDTGWRERHNVWQHHLSGAAMGNMKR